jgi:hypothetical protein
MCDPVTMVMGLVQAGGQVAQGRAANMNAGTEADMLEFEGRQAMDDAQGQASRIRRAGRDARGETLAAISASGVKVGEGSALDAERQVMTDYTQDEYMAILTGERQQRAANMEADRTRRAGREARRASRIQATTTLLGTAVQSARAGGWRSNGPGFSGTQRPAPIETISIGTTGQRSAYWRS